MKGRPGQHLAARWLGLRLPRRTIRLRLTLLYGFVFVVCAATLLGATYALVAHQYTGDFFIKTARGVVAVKSAGTAGNTVKTAPREVVPKILFPGLIITQPPTPSPADMVAQAHAQSTAALHKLLVDSAIALALMAMVSFWLG